MKVIITIDGELLASNVASQGLLGQKEAVGKIVNSLSNLLQMEHKIIIVHGNGPQVGNMLFRGEIASHAMPPVPLDVCGADTQGATGYFLQQSLRNLLCKKGLKREVTAVITQVLVDATDPALAAPIKGVGPFFDGERAQTYGNTRGWEFIMVPGRGQQRAVPAYLPREILEINSIRCLMENKTIVICGGGGGIPVHYDLHGQLTGVEAVVNKSHTATLLAKEVEADRVIFVSQWEKIITALPQAVKGKFTQLTLTELKEFIEQRKNELTDSMYLKLVASCKFLATPGKSICILPPEQLEEVLIHKCGIQLVSDPE
ncbi:MAG: carbamate kinase [Chloroflexi bacterium]|nr:MAG: carbamate kinase [Chloroflexota bacterium]